MVKKVNVPQRKRFLGNIYVRNQTSHALVVLRYGYYTEPVKKQFGRELFLPLACVCGIALLCKSTTITMKSMVMTQQESAL